MALLRVFSKIDEKNKITLPRGMRKELGINPGDNLELKVVGVNKARKLLIAKATYPRTNLDKKYVNMIIGVGINRKAGLR